jgi:predicted Zn-dependent protease
MGGTSDLLTGQAASAFQRAGRPEKAIELLEPYVQRRGAGALPGFWFLLGDAYEAKGQTDKAAEAFAAYAKTQQGANRMQGEYRAINARYAGGQTDRALAEGLAALERYPDFADLNYLVANCYELKGERGKAYALILENAQRHLQDAYAQLCCGVYHLTFGSLDAAEAALRYAIGLDPTHYPKMYAALAQVYRNRQDPVRAENSLREGVQATWDPELVLMLADALIARNSPAEAAGVLRSGVERNPADTTLRDRLRALESSPPK